MNSQNKLFSQGMKPVYRSFPSKLEWERIPEPCNILFDPKSVAPRKTRLEDDDEDREAEELEEDGNRQQPFTIGFYHKFQFQQQDHQPDQQEIFYFAFSYPFTYQECQEMLGSLELRYDRSEVDEIYFKRELLTKSIEGRRVDLLTITSRHGASNQREQFIGASKPKFLKKIIATVSSTKIYLF